MAIFRVQHLDDDGAILHDAGASVSAEDAARFYVAYRTFYPEVDDGAGGTRPLTDDEVWHRAAGGWLAGVIANIQSAEKSAAQAAVVVEPIAFVPVAPEPSA